MAAVWSAAGTNAASFDAAFAPLSWTITAATLGVGDIYLFLYAEQVGTTVPTVVIDGVTATQVGTTLHGTNTGNMSIWKATVTHASGNISISSASSYATLAASWGLITGNGAPTLTSVETTGAAASPGQGPITGTVPANGVGVIAIGATFGSASNTWDSPATNNPNMDASAATSNKSGVAGATIGAGTISVHNTTAGWAFNDNWMVMLSFPSSGGGGSTLPPQLMVRGIG
jgi:hypothetical protein